ncbi:hypothetical protein CPAR01_09055 [Colletotrichum paranaense]|uniref:Uncharacterized protein n=2 Tax=Colletotrichum acutatum species complex TaxID=2707335 RepID=A0AAI9V107_9PEZI|nr:uncharacterized protein CPAR01_09055 [Colletotrichum paranaense]KAK1466704.1 hypothetical protein CMEL01_10697 [Colletotrichum melonis]KAK1535513.1 hypothetical protein CPAR01_09055 [Colletotrichum paranaense]
MEPLAFLQVSATLLQSLVHRRTNKPASNMVCALQSLNAMRLALAKEEEQSLRKSASAMATSNIIPNTQRTYSSLHSLQATWHTEAEADFIRPSASIIARQTNDSGLAYARIVK